MAKIERKALISDEAIRAPLETAENVEKLISSIEKLVSSGKKSNVILETAKSSKELNTETKKLSDSQKELEKIDKRIAKEMDKGNDTIIKRQAALKKLQKRNRENVKEELARQNAMKGALGTEEKLRQSNKDLRAERKKLNIETDEGAARLIEINDEIDTNTKSLKGLSDSYTKQKMKIGDYRGQLQGLLVNMESLSGAKGGLFGLFATITGGLGKATKASLRFIATPIGAILAAIVVAVGALGAAFTSNAEGAKFFNEVMSGIGDVLDFLLGRFAMFGNAIIKLLSGDFSGAANEASKAISGLGEGMKDAYNAAVAYEKLLRAIKDQTIENTTAVARLQSELDILNQRAGDATISLREQNKAAIAAARAQIELTEQKLKLSKMEQERAQRAFDKARKNESTDIKAKEQALADATALVIEHESERTMALAENVTLRRQIRQDEGERYLDFLLDNFDNVKMINERIIANEKKALEERKQLLFQTSDLGVKAFEEQIDLLQQFTDKTIEADKLLSTVDSTALYEAVEALGMSDVLNGRLLEVLRDRRTAVQDLEEAYRELQDSQNILEPIERRGGEDMMPELPDTLPMIKQQLTAEEQAIQDSYDKRIDWSEGLKEALKFALTQGLQETIALVQEATQGQLDFVNSKLDNLEERKERELEIAGRNAEERAEIEEKFFQEQQELEEERAKLKTKQAKLDKASALASAIVNTAQGVSSALALGPFGIPLAILIGALGAAQIGVIASQPIPQFSEGTDSSPEGLAVVNEEGGELMEKNGKFSMVKSKGAALTYLQKGTKIHTAKETQDLLTSGLSGGISMKKAEETNGLNSAAIIKELSSINKSVKSQRQFNMNVTSKGVERLLRNGQNYTKLINSDFK